MLRSTHPAAVGMPWLHIIRDPDVMLQGFLSDGNSLHI
jgi:hypothetical protein